MNIATRCGGHHATVMANAMENPRATTICNMLPCGRSRGGRAVIFRHPIGRVSIGTKHDAARMMTVRAPRTWETKTMRPVMETLRSISMQSLHNRGTREDLHEPGGSQA
jgi:hypothetical protein